MPSIARPAVLSSSTTENQDTWSWTQHASQLQAPTQLSPGASSDDDSDMDTQEPESYVNWVRRRRQEQRDYNPSAPVDVDGAPPPNEVPTCYYAVIQGFRNTEPETRELVFRVSSTFGTVTDFTYRVLLCGSVSFYIGFYSIVESIGCVILFPRQIAAQSVSASVANSIFL